MVESHISHSKEVKQSDKFGKANNYERGEKAEQTGRDREQKIVVKEVSCWYFKAGALWAGAAGGIREAKIVGEGGCESTRSQERTFS